MIKKSCLSNGLEKIGKNSLMAVLFVVFIIGNFELFGAAPTDLAVRFIGKAKSALADKNIDMAYKNINTALVIAYKDVDKEKDEKLYNDVISTAQLIYENKINELLVHYDYLECVELKMNLDNFPLVVSPEIQKLLVKLTAKESGAQANDKLAAYEERLEELENERDILAESQNEFTKVVGEAINKNVEETKRSTNIIAFAVISISAIILVVVLVFIIILKKGFSQQHLQQEQYIQAFKMMAANNVQNGLGGVTDIYGNHSPLKMAGSSVWNAKALPEITFNDDDERELKDLAIKCEELGSRIDSVTGRKNNSKNVSEIVYKLSMQLGLSTELSMLNFCAAMVYDAGFLGIDPDLLSSSILTKEEKEGLKIHVSLAEDYLSFVPKKYWSIFEDAVKKHHENMDGSGYPSGLKGDEIPLIARLIHIAESYISISSRRAYRAPIDKETAVAKLKAEPQFYDEEIVDALDKMV